MKRSICVPALVALLGLALVAAGPGADGQNQSHSGDTVAARAHPSLARLLGEAPADRGNRTGQRTSDVSDRMELLFNSPTGATNSDLAFWGDRAFVGNYEGFRIFDVSTDPPTLLSDFDCFGPQNDPSVWDADGDDEADLLFLSIDRTLTGPECGAEATDHDDPDGWEGIRVFDVSDPTDPQFVTGVYQDCGSHTHTLIPDPERDRVLLLNSSYPLRPGPTCGQVRGPEAGRDPLHGVVQVVQVPLDDPAAADELTELPITYPGDPDNQFVWAEHGLGGIPDLEPAARACHDIAVYLPDMVVAGACAEQGQLWRIDPATMLPDTQNPIWVFDDQEDETGTTGDPDDPGVVVDFFHSATFTWDGQIVNFIDESFGDGCPPTTPAPGLTATFPGDSGRAFFLDAASGGLLSHFMIPRTEEGAYCSAHVGNVVPAPGRYLLVNAWYMGGADVINFTAPRNPREIAFFDLGPAGATGSDNWTHYWYEQSPRPGTPLRTYGQDGVHSPETGRGFEVFDAFVGLGTRFGVDHLNPQTQEVRLP